MHFLPEQLTGLPESSDRRVRVRRNPSAIAYLDAGEGNGGIVLNVSETGMAIAVAQALTDDEIPVLSFRLPQLDRTFQAGGEVIWRSASKKSAGVRFTNLDERDRSQIRNWIRAEIVESELKAPAERVNETTTSGPAKSVLVMPSRAARKAARQEEFEAERDEARAAEFDRMFPSEAELAGLAAPAQTERGLVDVSSGDTLLEITDHDDVEQAAEAFHASLESSEAQEPITDGAVSGHPAQNRDWREEWEQFHIERENLERMRSSETGWELPRPFSAPLPEESIPLPAGQETETAETVADVAPAAAEEKVEAAPRRVFVRARAEGLDWYQAPQGGAPFADATLPQKTPSASEAAIPARASATAPKTEKDALSIAALCVMLVLMCFVLGYAIQPGSFRFSSLKNWGAAREAPEVAGAPQIQPASEQIPGPANPRAGGVTPGANEPVVRAENNVAAEDAGPKKASPVTTSAPPVASNEVTRPAHANPAPEIGRNKATTAEAGATTAPAAAAAAGNASELTIDAPVPVSFFPVTAPAEGSPAKMMVLPEETILQTRDILIRSHQFLFVPPLPGLESTHELERVHLGDRIAKMDPNYAPQSLEKYQGSSIHLRSTIGEDGRVNDVQAISGPTSLIPAAVNAVRQWRYKPTDINGKPIAIEEDIVIEVRPSHS